jgi:hypothetical protein
VRDFSAVIAADDIRLRPTGNGPFDGKFEEFME